MNVVERVEQIEIQLGHLCNNRCVFCSSGLITSFGLVGQEDSARALAELEVARDKGARRVTFVGGEPTLQRDFPRILAHARSLGYEEIVLFTNGVRTQQRAYLEELCKGGPLSFRVSIQGGDRATHDRVTGRRGAFERIIEGLRLMNELGQKITVNACINAESYKSVGGYPELARRYNVEQVHLDQINPLEIGNRPPGYLETILVRYSEQAPYLSRMLEDFARRLGPDYDVNLGNIPFCVMPEWAHRIHHAGEQTVVVSANLGGLAESGHDKYERKTEHKIKVESCGRCAFSLVCTGVFKEYAAEFGTEELRAVPLERLRRQANAAELFTLIEQPALSRLASAEPEGFALEGTDFDAGGRQARFVYRAIGGDSPVELTVRHADARGAPVALSERIAVFLSAGRIDARTVELVGWAFDRLVGEGDRVRLRPTLAEVQRRVSWGERTRRQLASLVGRVATGPLGPFRHLSSRWAEDGESATVRVADGAHNELCLRLSTEPPYRTPRVRARISSAARSGDARRPVEQLLAALSSSLAG